MARKPDASRAPTVDGAAPRTASALRDLRARIDKLDLEILRLVNERARIAGEIGRVKNDQGEEIFSPAREEEVIQGVLDVNDRNGGPLDKECVRAIYREIMSGSRALQRVLKVAYLGPEYSFSHLAAVERFGQSIHYLPVGSIAAVFEQVNRGHVDFGVVPVDNSTDGRIADTLDMFIRMPHLVVCGEIRLAIHHNLLAACEPQDICRVYSKPQALSQCRNWLSKNLPNALVKEVSSTTAAAELAQKEKGAAAVASRQAAVRYGLRVLFPEIEDFPNNETRFAVIGHTKCAKTGHDKTAVMFRVPHSPGALVQALEVFRQAKINLTWIESFPARTSNKPEYIFFVDFEGHSDDTKVHKALKALGEHCHEVTVLGSFPMAETIA
jgi:chorismate mutase/prephenate dehydratase